MSFFIHYFRSSHLSNFLLEFYPIPHWLQCQHYFLGDQDTPNDSNHDDMIMTITAWIWYSCIIICPLVVDYRKFSEVSPFSGSVCVNFHLPDAFINTKVSSLVCQVLSMYMCIQDHSAACNEPLGPFYTLGTSLWLSV